MKKSIFLLFMAIVGLRFGAEAQLSFGVKGGMNLQIARPNTLTINAIDSTVTLSGGNTKFGQQIGIFVRLGRWVWLQPEVLYAKNAAGYLVGSPSGDLQKVEKFEHIELPVFLGIGAEKVRLHGGPVGRYFLTTNSELTDIKGYQPKFKSFTWGWQAGFNFGSERFSVDIRFEGNFDNLGDHFRFGGVAQSFDKKPMRIIANANYAIY